MLDNVVLFERASGNAMHERGAVVSDGSKAILVLRAQKAADTIYLTLRCLVVMEPLPGTLSSFFHFETVDKFSAISGKSSNAQVKTRPHQVDLPVELSRNQCALRSGNY